MCSIGQVLDVQIIALVIASTVGVHLLAQAPAPVQQNNRNLTVFAEAWGEGVYNSLNIEKMLTTPSIVSYHLRMGFGFWTPKSVNFYSLPVNAAISFGHDLKAELSVGATPFWLATREARVSSTFAPTLGIHLRWMERGSGFFIRAGALIARLYNLNKIPGNKDAWEKGTWGWNPGIALGFTY